MLSRRRLLELSIANASALAWKFSPARAATPSACVNDITRLNPIEVRTIATPSSTVETQRLVGDWRGPISIGGARYSMGGQIGAEESLHLDMRGFNRIVNLDVERMTVRVQSGMRWRDLQELIDPHGLSVKIMQSYSNFTVGGALSVNAHGRYVGLGPVVNSVRGIQLVLPDGNVVEANRTQNSELFRGAIGGYGGLGVVTEIELDLVPNMKIERQTTSLALNDYVAFFKERIRSNSDAVFHNANLEFPHFDRALLVTWVKTENPVTVAARLHTSGKADLSEVASVWALSEFPSAHYLRQEFFDPLQYRSRAVVWRNYEASLDVASLGPIATNASTYALQEYFVPPDQLAEFAREMARILEKHDVNALNVSIRHSPSDTEALLAWAQREVFSFVLYYKQSVSNGAKERVGRWTRELIDAALSVGGTYYLPYQLHATRQQFNQAYPRATDFFALKAKVDPRNQFRNKLWEKYAGA